MAEALNFGPEPPVRSHHTHEDDIDYNLALRNRLNLETVDKDEAKMGLRHVQKVLDKHLKSMAFLTEERCIETAWNKIEESFENLERDLNNEKKAVRNALNENASSQCNYGVLRSSLNDSQKRVESLNTDMKSQQEANSELIRSLGTVKDANKRLLDQIHHHTATISTLTQQRVQDEQRLDEMSKEHRIEEAKWRKDLRRRLGQRQGHLEDQYKHAEGMYQERLTHIKTRAEILLEELKKVKTVHSEIAAEAKRNQIMMQDKLTNTTEDLKAHMEKQAERHLAARSVLQSHVQELDHKLVTEKDARVREVAVWKQKHASTQATKDDTAEVLVRQVTQKTSQVHCLERTVQAEIRQNDDRREKLKRTIEEQMKEKSSVEAQLDEANREYIRLESETRALENECLLKEETLRKTRKQTRENEDSLHAATNGNLHLQQQLGEQKLKFEEANARELDAARRRCEERLKNLQETNSREHSIAQTLINTLTEDVNAKQQELDRQKNACEGLSAENATFERDLQMWKTTFEQANQNRLSQENALAELRQEWTKQKLSIQEKTEITNAKRQTAESDLEILSSQFQEFKRQSAARETEVSSRINALEENLKQLKSSLEDSKNHLNETNQALKTVKADSLATYNKQMDALEKLDRDLEVQNQEWNSDKNRLEMMLAAERRNAVEHKARFEKWRETHNIALREAQDDAQTRLQQYERERARLQDCYRQEIEQARNEYINQQKKLATLKETVASTTKSYHETQQSIQIIKLDTDKHERNINLLKTQHSEEVRSVQAAVDSARKAEACLEKQYRSTKERFEKERQELKAVEHEKYQSAPHVSRLDKRAWEQNLEKTRQAFKETSMGDTRRSLDQKLADYRYETDKHSLSMDNLMNPTATTKTSTNGIDTPADSLLHGISSDLVTNGNGHNPTTSPGKSNSLFPSKGGVTPDFGTSGANTHKVTQIGISAPTKLVTSTSLSKFEYPTTHTSSM